MITNERKGELMAEFEYSVNRYLDKQWVISDIISNIAEDEEETRFMNNLNYYFAVLLPEEN